MLGIYIFSIIVLIALGWYVTRRKINPVTIYNAIWLIVVLLYQLRLSNLQAEVDNETYWLLIVKSFIFTIVFLMFYAFKFTFKGKKKNPGMEGVPKKIVGFSTLDYKKILVPMFLVWCSVELFETIYSGGLPIIWKAIGDSRTYFDYGVSSLHGLMNALGLVIVTMATLAFLKEKKQNNRVIFGGMIVFCLAFYLCLITRQVLISAVIQMISVYVLMKQKINYRKLLKALIVIVLIGIIAFGVIGNFRTGYDGFLNVAGITTSIPPLFIGFYWVYMYLTMSIANINNAVILGVNHYGGLYPVAKVFLPTVLSKAIFAESTIAVPNYLVTNSFNVSGYFIDFYTGMGLQGVVLIAALYGLLGGIIYRLLRQKKTEKRILLYVVFLQIIILSFFFNHLFYLPSGFQLVIILVVYHILEKRGAMNEKVNSI